MFRSPIVMVGWLVAGILTTATVWAQEETSTQLWGNVILGYPHGERLYFEVDFEGQRQVSGGEPWRAVYATPLVEYYPNKWLDLTGEVTVGYADQTENLDSFEVTPRVGIRLHLLGNMVQSWLFEKKWRAERLPLGKVFLANLLRLESRNFYYSDDQESSHELRLRNRLEFKVPINNPNLGDDKTLYLFADGEVYVPLDNPLPERFATKVRLRIGTGYRFSYKARLELLYIQDWARNTLQGDFRVDANMLGLRLRLFF